MPRLLHPSFLLQTDRTAVTSNDWNLRSSRSRSVSESTEKLERTKKAYDYKRLKVEMTSPIMGPGFAAYHSDFDESIHINKLPHPQQPRQRRRQSSTSDGPKHRRTRSGCYTCRQRRVKCDETHPICDRCRKGKRECTYPQNASSSSNSASRATSHRYPDDAVSKGTSSDGQSTPSLDYEDVDELRHVPLSVIPDNEEDHAGFVGSSEHSPLLAFKDGADFALRGSSITAARKQPVARSEKQQSRRTPNARHIKSVDLALTDKWRRLPKEMDAYLRYHRDHLTYHHYAFKYDRTDFLKTTFLEIALNDDSSALLYAIVAFSAYHHAVQSAKDSWQTFLTYYNKAIEALNRDLKRYKRHNTATLLTILQLATIEEFLGDWLNLHHHQRAAYQILTELYRVDTIMQDETRRKIIMWYFRFDIFAGLLAGAQPCLGREWYAACEKFYRAQASKQPGDVATVIEHYFATSRLLAVDITLLFAAKKQGVIGEEQFSHDAKTLLQHLDAFGRRLEKAFTDDSCFADVNEIVPAEPGEIQVTNWREPRFVYSGDYFSMNFVLLDYWALHLVFDYQMEMTQGRHTSLKLFDIAMKKCKIVEGIYHSNKKPTGALLGCQASIAALSLFLGTTRENVEWCRRKFAMVEAEGYIYPSKVREQMTRLWGEDVLFWWLPNRAGLSPTIQMIKDFVEFRRVVPKDLSIANLCDMSGMFLSLDATENSLSPTEPRLPRVDSGYAYQSQIPTWNFQKEPVTSSG